MPNVFKRKNAVILFFPPIQTVGL